MTTPTYDELAGAYSELIASGNEPDLVLLHLSKSTKSVRRTVGRWLRRKQIEGLLVVPVFSHGRLGFYKV